jgi:hypothetical protein
VARDSIDSPSRPWHDGQMAVISSVTTVIRSWYRSPAANGDACGRERGATLVGVKKPTDLRRCCGCGEFRNAARNVLCICSGYVCSSYRVGRMRRPISDHYDEDSGKLWHTPSFLGLRHCACGAYAWMPASEATAA